MLPVQAGEAVIIDEDNEEDNWLSQTVQAHLQATITNNPDAVDHDIQMMAYFEERLRRYEVIRDLEFEPRITWITITEVKTESVDATTEDLADESAKMHDEPIDEELDELMEEELLRGYDQPTMA